MDRTIASGPRRRCLISPSASRCMSYSRRLSMSPMMSHAQLIAASLAVAEASELLSG